MFKNFIIVLVCFWFLTSCRATRQETQKTVSTTENSVEKKETSRDTIFFTPKSETELTMTANTLFKDSLKTVKTPKVYTQKNGNATVKIKVQGDTITASATCDSLALKAQIKRELLKQFSATSNNQVTELLKDSGYTFIDIMCFLVAGIVIGIVGTITIKGIL